MIRTIYSFSASFHFQGLAFGARKHADGNIRRTCYALSTHHLSQQQAPDWSTLNQYENESIDVRGHAWDLRQIFQLRYVSTHD